MNDTSSNNRDTAPSPEGQTKSAKAKPGKLPIRFYKNVSINKELSGYRILLDERPIKTPKRKLVEVNQEKLALALKAEWEKQDKHIDPTTMPLTKLVNTALDGISGSEEQVAADLAQYALSDALCYRAAHPQDLVARQKNAWDPVIKWSKEELGITLKTTTGVMPLTQPKKTQEKAAHILRTYDPLELAGLHVLTTMTGSLIITLALVRGRLTAKDAWNIAHIDEDYQLSKWGADEEALERLAWRRKEFNAAHQLLSLLH